MKRAQGMLGIVHGAVDDFKSVIPVMKDSKASINLQPHMLNPVKIFSLFKRMLDEVLLYKCGSYEPLNSVAVYINFCMLTVKLYISVKERHQDIFFHLFLLKQIYIVISGLRTP